METNSLLNKARKEYPRNTLFYSATGNIKSPIMVTGLKISENYKNTIINVDGGVVFTEGVWAKKV